jgi:hypothetical protein
MIKLFDGFHVDVPLVVLIILLLLCWQVLYLSQKNGKLDLSNMLRDDAGKESGLRLAMLGAFAVSSWALMWDTIQVGSLDWRIFLIYSATWSGAPVFAKLIEKWNGGVSK